MSEQLAEALEKAGYEVDAEETRFVICRSNGTPVLELDWTSCDLNGADLDWIGTALSSIQT